jgi:two-component system LytT family sensor kinase
MREVTLTGDQFILVIVLVKLGVMASLTSFLVRSRRFTHALFTSHRTVGTQAVIAVWLGLPFLVGVLLRVVLNYEALDLSLGGPYVAGLLGGMHPGLVVGMLVGAPAFAHGEFLALPAGLAVGLVGGLVGRGRLLGESIWSFTPIPPYDLFQVLRHGVASRVLDPRAIILVSVLLLDMSRDFVSQLRPAWLHTLDPVNPWVQIAVWAGTLSSVGIAIKAFNSVRIESKLEDQGRLLALARYEALRSQINPHFLFNTLNSISSSIRTDSDRARGMIVKLSSILRRALEPHEDFVPLRDEIEFIDAYLDIETVRFGPRKLRVVKEIDPSLLDVPVPSMLLQPLVENAIRHGIAASLNGGTVVIRAERKDGHMLLTIADDGAGMPEEKIGEALTRGIGVRNVNERLQVVYGHDHGLELKGRAGGGIEVQMAIPTGARGSQAMMALAGDTSPKSPDPSG